MTQKVDNESSPEKQAQVKSKSQQKREAEDLQKAGEKLLNLPKQVRAKMGIPETLQQALDHANKLTSRSAGRRQRQYIGRLMRELDTENLLKQLAQYEELNSKKNTEFHLAESWRDKIIQGDDELISEFLASYPQAERQKLRQLVRQVRLETQKQAPPKASRLLFRYLREILQD